MAEVRKKEKVEKYNIDELAVKNKKQDGFFSDVKALIMKKGGV